MWLLADIVQTGMFLAGVVLLVFILLRRTYRYYGRRRPGKKGADTYLTHAPRPRSEQRSLTDAPPELLRWQVAMHDTARELNAELDSKMRVLQLLIGQARHEVDRLEQILSRLEASGCDVPNSPPGMDPSTWLPASPDRQAEIFALADQGQSASEIAEQVGTPVGEIELILSLRGAGGG